MGVKSREYKCQRVKILDFSKSVDFHNYRISSIFFFWGGGGVKMYQIILKSSMVTDISAVLLRYF